MYLAEYDDGQMHGLGKKLRKAVKSVAKAPVKLVKQTAKVVKKAAPLALHAGAAILTGGATLPLSMQMYAGKQAAKAQEEADRQAQEQAARDAAAFADIQKAAAAPMVAPAAAPVARITSIAPAADFVDAEVSPAKPPALRSTPAAAPAGSKPPTWIYAAGVAAAVGAAIILTRGRGRTH